MKLWHLHVTDIQVHPHNYLVRRQKPWERREWAWSPLLMAGPAGSRIQALWTSPVLSPPWQALSSSLSTFSWSSMYFPKQLQWLTEQPVDREIRKRSWSFPSMWPTLVQSSVPHIWSYIFSTTRMDLWAQSKESVLSTTGNGPPNKNAYLAKKQPDKVKPD